MSRADFADAWLIYLQALNVLPVPAQSQLPTLDDHESCPIIVSSMRSRFRIIMYIENLALNSSLRYARFGEPLNTPVSGEILWSFL
jgi:hypothetical protein